MKQPSVTFSEVKSDGAFKKVFRDGSCMGIVKVDLKKEELPEWLFEHNITFGKKCDGFDPGLPPWSYRAVFKQESFIGYQSLDPVSGGALNPFLWGNEKKD